MTSPKGKLSVSDRISKGRKAVADGLPKLPDRIKTVMGDQQMTISQILTGLEERQWSPVSSKPRDYITAVLTRDRDFQRVRRGVYQVKKS